MNLQELRIGNWFYYSGGWLQPDGEFQWNESYWLKLLECRIDLEHIHPIPLTTEWLEKFGFKGTIGQSNPFCGYNSVLFIDDNSNVEIYYCNTLLRVIQYVHQLQNLYFALLGKELEII
jgi:hypothetical protein